MAERGYQSDLTGIAKLPSFGVKPRSESRLQISK